MEYRFIGIDPGKSGHVVILDGTGNIVAHHKTPLIGKEYDKSRMAEILECVRDRPETEKVHVVLEDVHTTQMGGKASNFDFGRGKGLWEMALMALRIPHTMVRAKEWQKLMWQGAKTQYKVGGKKKSVDTKATSLLAAKMLQPNQEWKKMGAKGQPLKDYDDGFVDAYLMAEYCRRKFY